MNRRQRGVWQMRRRERLAVLALGVAALTVMSGCSSSPPDATTSPTESSSATPAAEAVPESIAAQFAQGVEGTFIPPVPSTTKPEAGKKITVIVTGALQATTQLTDAFQAATDAVGWTLKVVDGQYSPDVQLQAIRQAVAEKVDGIALWVIDCATVKAGAEEAKAAGIPIIYIESFDCNENGGTGSATGHGVGWYNTLTTEEGDYRQLMLDTGALQAAAAIVATDAEMNALVLDYKESIATSLMTEAFVSTAEECAGCETTVVDALFGDFGSVLQSKVQTALLQDPTINVVFASYDDPILNGVAAGVAAAGRDVFITGEGAYPQWVDMIREGKPGMSVAYDTGMEGWAAVEKFSRLFRGDTTDFPMGHGVVVVDAENNMQEAGALWAPPFDYAAAYKAAWGIQ